MTTCLADGHKGNWCSPKWRWVLNASKKRSNFTLFWRAYPLIKSAFFLIFIFASSKWFRLFPVLPFWHFSNCLLPSLFVFSPPVKNESTRRIAWTNWLVRPLSEKPILFFSHMALLRRKETCAAYRRAWCWALGSCGPALAGCSCTKANLLSCSLGKRFMVHGQKSDLAMLAQLILIRHSGRTADSETTDLRLNSFGSQRFAWTFLATDSSGPKDSKQIPDTDWKHAAPTVYRVFPN